MNTQKLLELALQSPVLVAFIYGVVAIVGGIVGGRWLLGLKDEQIKTKDEQISTLKDAYAAQLKVKDDHITNLERWMPVHALEDLEATKKIFQMQLDSANETIDLLTNQNVSDQQKGHELEVKYRAEIDTLTGQLTTANQTQAELRKTLYGILSGSDVPDQMLGLHVTRNTAAWPTEPVLENWPEWTERYLKRYREIIATRWPPKGAPIDEEDKSLAKEREENP